MFDNRHCQEAKFTMLLWLGLLHLCLVTVAPLSIPDVTGYNSVITKIGNSNRVDRHNYYYPNQNPSSTETNGGNTETTTAIATDESKSLSQYLLKAYYNNMKQNSDHQDKSKSVRNYYKPDMNNLKANETDGHQHHYNQSDHSLTKNNMFGMDYNTDKQFDDDVATEPDYDEYEGEEIDTEEAIDPEDIVLVNQSGEQVDQQGDASSDRRQLVDQKSNGNSNKNSLYSTYLVNNEEIAKRVDNYPNQLIYNNLNNVNEDGTPKFNYSNFKLGQFARKSANKKQKKPKKLQIVYIKVPLINLVDKSTATSLIEEDSEDSTESESQQESSTLSSLTENYINYQNALSSIQKLSPLNQTQLQLLSSQLYNTWLPIAQNNPSLALLHSLSNVNFTNDLLMKASQQANHTNHQASTNSTVHLLANHDARSASDYSKSYERKDRNANHNGNSNYYSNFLPKNSEYNNYNHSNGRDEYDGRSSNFPQHSRDYDPGVFHWNTPTEASTVSYNQTGQNSLLQNKNLGILPIVIQIDESSKSNSADRNGQMTDNSRFRGNGWQNNNGPFKNHSMNNQGVNFQNNQWTAKYGSPQSSSHQNGWNIEPPFDNHYPNRYANQQHPNTFANQQGNPFNNKMNDFSQNPNHGPNRNVNNPNFGHQNHHQHQAMNQNFNRQPNQYDHFQPTFDDSPNFINTGPPRNLPNRNPNNLLKPQHSPRNMKMPFPKMPNNNLNNNFSKMKFDQSVMRGSKVFPPKPFWNDFSNPSHFETNNRFRKDKTFGKLKLNSNDFMMPLASSLASKKFLRSKLTGKPFSHLGMDFEDVFFQNVPGMNYDDFMRLTHKYNEHYFLPDSKLFDNSNNNNNGMMTSDSNIINHKVPIPTASNLFFSYLFSPQATPIPFMAGQHDINHWHQQGPKGKKGSSITAALIKNSKNLASPKTSLLARVNGEKKKPTAIISTASEKLKQTTATANGKASKEKRKLGRFALFGR